MTPEIHPTPPGSLDQPQQEPGQPAPASPMAPGNEDALAPEAAAQPALEAVAAAAAGAVEAVASASTPAAEPPSAKPVHASAAEVGRLLAERFPALFGQGVARPIKLRIQADLQARAPGLVSRKALSIFLQRHTTSTAYLKALIAAEQRLDLDGQPAGEVAAEHRAAAQVELERRRQIVAERRAAERGPRPPRRDGPRGDRPRSDGPRGQVPADRPHGAPADSAASGTPAQRPRGGERGRRDAPLGETGRDPSAPRQARNQSPRPRPDRAPTGREARPGPAAERPHPRGAARERPHHPPRSGPPAAPERLDTSPDAAARRSRSQLLQAFEASPLSKANFCALKGLRESEFDALIAEARADRSARAA